MDDYGGNFWGFIFYSGRFSAANDCGFSKKTNLQSKINLFEEDSVVKSKTETYYFKYLYLAAFGSTSG